MKIFPTGLLFSLIGAACLLIQSDTNDPFERLLANLEKQTYDYVQEKVYLHMDKPFYAKGDDLWFKAYTVAGPNHTPTPLSENLYVELLDPQGEVLKRHTIFISKGLGRGDFHLADSLSAGSYRIRAFTNWMRNFDQGFYYQRQFELIDPFETTANNQVSSGEEALTIRFFPEGGDLVQNIPTQIAFELNTDDELSGVVYDQDGNQVVAFTSGHEGRGEFSLLPMEGKQYFVRLNAGEQRYPLPEVRPTGFVLNVDNLSNPDFVQVNVKTASGAATHETFLIAHTRGLVGFASRLEWKGAVARVKIPRAQLPEGVNHLTLFNTEWQPEAERLIFQQQNNALFSLTVETDKQSYSPRDSTTIKLKLTDKEGRPIKAFFSMNVLDAEQISPDSFTEDIRSSLLLSSDLKGEVEKPVQYFDQSNAQAQDQLDLLLMTRGWSRFTWKDLLNETFVEVPHSVERGFNISGKVTQKNNDKALARSTVKQVGVFEGMPSFREASTNGRGEFLLERLHYYENGSVIKAKDKKGKSNVALQLDAPEQHDFEHPVLLPTDLNYSKEEQVSEAFVNRSRERTDILRAFNPDSVTDLGSVVVEADAIDREFANLSRGLLFNRGEYGVNVTDAMSRGQRYQNALYALQGKVPGLNIVLGTNGEPNVILNRKVFSFINPDPPIAYYIDDAPADLGAVTALPAEKVERIEVLKGMRATSVYGPSANGGAIVVYTKTAEEYDRYYQKLAENQVVLDKSTRALKGGYYRSRVFYTPNYRGELKNEVKPDHRDLIHWEPMIETDENGEAVVRFFNADLTTTIYVNVEGIWEGGIPLVANTTYKVEK